MSLISVRKTQVSIEEVFHEGAEPVQTPLRVGTALAVVKNPYAGEFQADLMPFMAELRALGESLSKRLVQALGGADKIQAYGKGIIVGDDGDLEQGAVWHEAGGWAMRQVLGEPKAIVPAAKTIGGVGTRIMVPLGHIHAAYVRSHFNTAEMTIWDAPRRNEIVYGLVMATGGRIHARIGGLAASDVKGQDGLR
ncbi:MAG TPA: amino acid synthesis family protein [Eoetvoesiella sp.]